MKHTHTKSHLVPHFPADPMTFSLDDLMTPIHTTHGAVCGVREDRDAVQEHAELLSLDEVLLHIEHAASHEAPQVLGALLILQHQLQALPYDEATSWTRLHEALVACACDVRSHVIPWGTASYQKKTWAIADRAVDVLVRVWERVARGSQRVFLRPEERTSRDAQTQTRVVRALAVLLNAPESTGTRALLSSWRRPFLHSDSHEETAQALCALLVERALDTKAIAVLRIHAARSLRRAARLASTSLKPHFLSASTRVAESLRSAYTAPLCDLHLRAHIPELLHDLDPKQLDTLLIETQPQPPTLSAPCVLTRWGRFDPGNTQKRALSIASQHVRHILAAPNEHSASETIAALGFVSVMSDRVDWDDVATYLLNAIEDRRVWTLPPSSAAAPPSPICVGSIALRRLSSLISSRWRLHPETCTQWIFRALDRCIESIPDAVGSTDDDVQAFLRDLRWGPTEVTKALHARLSSWCLDTNLPTHQRLCAISATRSRSEPKVALSILQNPDESPPLRACIGAQMARWSSTALHTFIQNNPGDLRWIPNDDARDLPISEPAQRVPTSWLFASLRAAESPTLQRHLIRHIGTRFSLSDALRLHSAGSATPDSLQTAIEHIEDNLYRLTISGECTQVHSSTSPQPATSTPFQPRETLLLARQTLLKAQTPHFLQLLRHTIDTSDPQTRSSSAWGAAMILALLGHLEDRSRLLKIMLQRDLWTFTDVLQNPEVLRSLAYSIALDPMRARSPHHLLEPYVRIGYGEEAAARILGKLFVHCAAQASCRGDLVRARMACLHALRWDPLNLNAHRGSQDPSDLCTRAPLDIKSDEAPV